MDLEMANGAPATPSVHLQWQNLVYTIEAPGKDPQGKTIKEQRAILNDVSGEVRPGQTCAILGASGAGKSTLLNLLAGRIEEGVIKGAVVVNGKPRPEATWRRTVCFVEQDDLMLPFLTVRETLSYAAQLRLPSNMTHEQKMQRVDEIISQLGLSKCANTRIGSAIQRGISGGERKRVSIGIELVTNPSLLFLDEPTSGLDAFTAVTIIDVLHKLATDKQKTVLCTIHQPRVEILELFDRIILLAGGRCVYFGPMVEGAIPHFESMGYPCPPLTNPSDFFLDTITTDFRSADLRETSLTRIKMLQDKWSEIESKVVSPQLMRLDQIEGAAATSNQSPFANGPVYEFVVLFTREMKNIFRNPANVGASLGQATILTIVFGVMFLQMDLTSDGVQNRIGFLFVLVINQTFGVVMPIIGTLPDAKALIRRERASATYHAFPAFFAKAISSLILPCFSSLLLSTIVYWMVGLQNNATKYLIFLLAIQCHSVCSNFLGLCIGSVVPNAFVGQIFGPLLIMVMMLFGGQLVNTDSITGVISWLKYVSIIRYTYSVVTQNEFKGLVFTCKPPTSTDCPISGPGQKILDAYNLDEQRIFVNLLCIALIAAVFLIVGATAFMAKTRPKLKLR